ncbi:hypothetical protein J6W34_09075 [bacterium]|nr:hypothetical protein [bacterium]
MQNNNYKIIINDVYLFNDKINKEQNTELNRRILFKLRDQVISNVMVSPDSWYNTDFIFGLLVKDFQYTYYFDTLQELSKSNEKNNQSYEEFLLNVYKEEFNIENVDYNFSSSLTINSLKLNKYVEAINNFLNDTSNNENSLQLYKIYKNKVYFKKSNNNIYYEELSTGEKKLLSESIFWLKLFFQKHTNSEENYVNKLNINKQINMLYFIDEIELGFHPV